MAARLDRLIAQMRADWKVPGLSVAVVKDGKTVLCKGYGETQIGDGRPVDSDTLFAIASNTKAFTAAALAILVDEGKLGWDDHVHDYLPWLRLRDPLASNDLRIRDLLCHRSGLGTFSGDLLWWQTSYSPREVLQRARHLESAGPFRAHYGYSNLMFLAAGEVIEQVSDMSYSEFVATHILGPVGMARTKTSTRQLGGLENVATPHKTLQVGSEPIEWVNWDSMTAAGGIISSAREMALWMNVQLGEGKLPTDQAADSRVFSAKQSHQMWHPQTIIPVSSITADAQYRAYGLGWSIRDYHGNRVIGHGGGYDGMYSQVQLVTDRGLGIVVLTNSMTSVTGAITSAVLDAYLLDAPDETILSNSEKSRKRFLSGRERFQERIDAAVRPNPDGQNVKRPIGAFVGTYRCPLYGDATVADENGKLVLRLLPAKRLVADLEHLHFNTYKINWRSTHAWFDKGACHFIDDPTGNIVSIELDIPNDDMWFYELDLRRTDTD
ncbi:MAG: serine hydrolase [Aureliella sp.]